MTPERWIIDGDTGMSSKLIWGVMTGAITEFDDYWSVAIPYDSDDFGRCYRLLNHFPSWKKKLYKVSEIFPKWKPFVENWNELTQLFEQESKQDYYTKDFGFYNLMGKIHNQDQMEE